MFLTNNSSKSIEEYIGKLQNMCIPAEKADFMTSLQATAHYLLSSKGRGLSMACARTACAENYANAVWTSGISLILKLTALLWALILSLLFRK